MEKELIDSIKPGAVVIVTERIKDKEKERTANFKGIVLARKHGTQKNATFTVRALVDSVGVEKVYPLFSPMIADVKIVSAPKKVRRAKIYYIREVSKKKSRKKIGVSV